MFAREITVDTKANTTDLTTLSRVKTEMGISGSGDDSLLNDLIAEATSLFEGETERVFAREQVTEKMGTVDRQRTIVTRRAPIIQITEITEDGDTVDAGDYEITDSQAGFIFNEGSWYSTQVWATDINPFPTRHQLPDFKVKHWAGYMLPGDDISGSTTVSADGNDNSFNDSANNFPPTLVSGDEIEVSGFSNSANNGTFTVAENSTKSKIKVNESLTTESTVSSGVDINIRDLPREVERAVIEIVKGLYWSGERDPALESETIGDFWKASYRTEGGSEIPPRAARIAKRWQRLV